MLRKVVKVRLYPTNEQCKHLAQSFGCARWWSNYALNKSIEVYQETGKGVGQSALNALLPKLKKQEEYKWLSDCYSQVLQATTLKLTTAYKNFFEKKARFPKSKSKRHKQSVHYPQNVEIISNTELKFPKLGVVKAKLHRPIDGNIKTVMVSQDPSGKYFAAILFEVEGENPEISTSGKISGIDLGLKHFAIVSDGAKVSKFENPKYFVKHQCNLKRKQQSLSRKKDGSNSRKKAKKLVANVHERVANCRQDFLHKLSAKLVNENQVVVVESLHVKGMVRNHCLAKAISDASWGMFVNFLSYKLERNGGKLVEIDRWFPSSKTCSVCLHQVSEMPLDVREWTCSHCGTHHDRDGNAAINIRNEGIRMVKTDGTAVSAVGGKVSPKVERKSNLRYSPTKIEAHDLPKGNAG
ncbi:RNA-guided endonuclease TnpB family protein [Microcoleus sp. AT3-A2]|uniref:RNA-guided endonuclease TnpB family protein n=1 Tax=Microcoleus sp. AT3-A2 TaxID=2818610 RepID=UPI002FCF3A75